MFHGLSFSEGLRDDLSHQESSTGTGEGLCLSDVAIEWSRPGKWQVGKELNEVEVEQGSEIPALCRKQTGRLHGVLSAAERLVLQPCCSAPNVLLGLDV